MSPVGMARDCRGCPCVARALTRRVRDDASHRPGRVGLSRKRERRSKSADNSREIHMRGSAPASGQVFSLIPTCFEDKVGPPDAVNTGGPVPLIEMLARKGGFAGLREATIRP